MQRKLHVLLFAFLTMAGTVTLQGQKSLIKAQKQFELKAFDLAIENAKKALKNKPHCVECHTVIAESFRMMNANVDAAIWYRKMEDLDDLPAVFNFNYGLLLKRMGQYDKAKKYFIKYKEVNPEKAELFAASCDYAKQELASAKDFELNLYNASSKSTDYGSTFFGDKIVFSSFRKDFKRSLAVNNSSIIQDDRCQLFIGAQGVTGTVNNLDFLQPDHLETYDVGPVHYAASAPKVAVTKNNFRDGEKMVFSNDLELALFTADVNADGSFENIETFPHNEVGYATGFGTMNESGNIMYFASNRPGGEGGFDIYVSYFKSGKWTYPENLGETVNTPGDEITPFFDGEDLYFSSNYHQGLGGFDVYATNVKAGKWNTPANMGNGVNSPEDDFYFVKHPAQNTFYLTSNRLGGRGNHDIYIVHKAEDDMEIMEDMVAFEEVVPAAVDLQKDVLVDNGNTPSVTAVKYEETNSIPETTTKVNTPRDNEPGNSIIEDVVDSEEIDFNKILPPKAVDLNRTNSKTVSLVGAKRVSYGEVIRTNSNVYFIQLAALFKNRANMDNYSPLSAYGNLYKFNQSSATKVKLGYFMDEYQAKDILRKVKSMGYADAFITFEPLNTSTMELVELSDASNGYSTGHSNYKVRLASYEDPIWFDVNSVSDLGSIEQWSKGDWTIFVLSGFDSKSAAERAKKNALSRGFQDAELVIDNGGILKSLD